MKLMLDSYVFLLPTLTWLLGSLKFRTILLPSICISLIVSDSILHHNPNPILHTAAYLLILSVGGVPEDDNPKDKLRFSFFFVNRRLYLLFWFFVLHIQNRKRKRLLGKRVEKRGRLER